MQINLVFLLKVPKMFISSASLSCPHHREMKEIQGPTTTSEILVVRMLVLKFIFHKILWGMKGSTLSALSKVSKSRCCYSLTLQTGDNLISRRDGPGSRVTNCKLSRVQITGSFRFQGPVSQKSRNFSGAKNPFVSSIGTRFVL